MTTIKEEALKSNFTKLFCIDCGKKIKDYRSLRCRKCWVDLVRELKPIMKFGKDNFKWKGDNVAYSALHSWLRRTKPLEPCRQCGSTKNTQVSNISGKYKRDINDYEWLCARCHVYKDGTVNNLNYRRYKKC